MPHWSAAAGVGLVIAAPAPPRPRLQLQMAGMAPYALPYAGNGGVHSSIPFFGAGAAH